MNCWLPLEIDETKISELIELSKTNITNVDDLKNFLNKQKELYKPKFENDTINFGSPQGIDIQISKGSNKLYYFRAIPIFENNKLLDLEFVVERFVIHK